MVYFNEFDPALAQWLRELMKRGLIAQGEVDERSIVDVRPGDLKGFTQCHFFAGIGTWSYALRAAGWPDDREVWTGSPPCQPFSAAGKGAGFDDERHLWPAWEALLRKRRPGIVLSEQVSAAIRHGWLGLVQADLERLGYAVGALCAPACGVGAPHKRERLYWCAVADATGMGPRGRGAGSEVPESGAFERSRGLRDACDLADAKLSGSARQREHGRPPTHGSQDISPTSGSCSIGDLGDSDGERLQGKRSHNDAQGWAYPQRPSGLPDGAVGAVNGFWRDAEWIACRDGKARAVESRFVALFAGSAADLGFVRDRGSSQSQGEKVSVSAHQAGSREVLRYMQQKVVKEALQGGTGVDELLSAPQVLRSGLHGEGAGTSCGVQSQSQQNKSAQAREGILRNLRKEGAPSRSSQGPRSPQQRIIKLADFVSALPSTFALAKLSGDTVTQEAMHSLLQSRSEEWFVQHSSDTSQEIWRSLADEEKIRIRLSLNSGQWVKGIMSPLSTDEPARVLRLKGYGNAVVAPFAQAWVEACMDVLGITRKPGAGSSPARKQEIGMEQNELFEGTKKTRKHKAADPVAATPPSAAGVSPPLADKGAPKAMSAKQTLRADLKAARERAKLAQMAFKVAAKNVKAFVKSANAEHAALLKELKKVDAEQAMALAHVEKLKAKMNGAA